jgi:hypothetical protein
VESRLKEYLLRRVLEWIGDAALDSGFGDLPDQDEEDLLSRPILFDPRFDLDPSEGVPLLIDLLEEDMSREVAPPKLRQRLAEAQLEAALVDAETVGEYLGVLCRALGAPMP